MSSDETTPGGRPPTTVFLSYASGVRVAARTLRDALGAHGLEVWYDENELGGGEAWDQKIRKQIRECRYFVALISAQTEARLEGYFRREWRLAVERTLDMADDYLFLLPIVIDDTDQASARVPDKFKSVQWLRVPGGSATPALEALCRRLTAETAAPLGAHGGSSPGPRASVPATAAIPSYPAFPAAVPGDKLRSWRNDAVWAARYAWAAWKRAPKKVRVLVIIGLVLAILSRGKSSDEPDTDEVPVATVEKLKALDKQDPTGANATEIAKIGAQLVKDLAKSDNGEATASPLLVLPFSVPADDARAAKVADASFAMVYGKLEISHRGHIGLSKQPLASPDIGAAVERGRANHSQYVLTGAIDKEGAAQALSIKIARVGDGRLLWSKSYPVAAADPVTIAADVDANAPPLDE
jgi:hypothetical protein